MHILVLILLIISTIYDITHHRIPNKITLPAIVFGFILNVYYSGFLGLKNSFLGTALGIGLLIIPFALGVIGGGDVKLLGAIGALNGYHFVFYAFLYSALVGGIMAVIYAAIKGRLRYILQNIFFTGLTYSLGGKYGRETGGLAFEPSNLYLPYAVPISIGTIITYLVR